MLDPFIIKALLAGIGIALASGPLGCFLAWRQLAYFGDTIAHAALLGVVLALLTQTDFNVGIIVVAVLITTTVFWLEKEKRTTSNMLLGMFAHGALALGLVLISLSKITVDVNSLLFGDILAVGSQDLWMIYTMVALTGFALVYTWRSLMRLTVHEDIARVEGVPARKLELGLMLLIALSVAISIKIIGILLMTAMLIIPAAAARYFSATPTQMAYMAILNGIVAVIGGMSMSLYLDTPSGPSIIVAAMVMFFVAWLVSRVRA